LNNYSRPVAVDVLPAPGTGDGRTDKPGGLLLDLKSGRLSGQHKRPARLKRPSVRKKISVSDLSVGMYVDGLVGIST
jgi:hypothetical protein